MRWEQVDKAVVEIQEVKSLSFCPSMWLLSQCVLGGPKAWICVTKYLICVTKYLFC